MTNDVTPVAGTGAPKRARRLGRVACLGAISLTAGLVLSGCTSSEGMYIEGWWDNGDPFYAPSKTVLFDENGDPTCAYPVKYNQFESRSAAMTLAKAVSFEIMNPETPVDAYMDPDDFPTEEDQAKEALRRERALNSVGILWEYTHPAFDEQYGIEGPDDLTPIKEELMDYLYGLGKDAPFIEYMDLTSNYFVSERGTFTVTRLNAVEAYLEANDVPLEFRGLVNEYYIAISEEGEEYLLVKRQSTGSISMWQGPERSDLTDAVWYATIDVTKALDTPSGLAPVVMQYTLQTDGCPDKGGQGYQRYYLRDYRLIDEEEEATDPESDDDA
jgi:hypothetical protein